MVYNIQILSIFFQNFSLWLKSLVCIGIGGRRGTICISIGVIMGIVTIWASVWVVAMGIVAIRVTIWVFTMGIVAIRVTIWVVTMGIIAIGVSIWVATMGMVAIGTTRILVTNDVAVSVNFLIVAMILFLLSIGARSAT